MTKTRIAMVSILGLVAVAAAAWASSKESHEPGGSFCARSTGERERGMKHVVAFVQQHDVVVTGVTVDLAGDPKALGKTIDKIVAQEASCCADLTITHVPSKTGRSVTVTASRDEAALVHTVLGALLDAAHAK